MFYIYYKVLLLPVIALNGLVMAYLPDLLRHYFTSRLLHSAKTGLHNPEDYFSQILHNSILENIMNVSSIGGLMKTD